MPGIRNKRRAAVIMALGLAWPTPTFAYVGDSFLNIPGYNGHWQGKGHKGWVRARGSDWPGRRTPLSSGSGNALTGDKLFFGGPNAPKPGGPGQLVLMFPKDNPDLTHLMEMCAGKMSMPELTYSESSDRARPNLELGKRPAEFPAFWQYKLKNVTVADCPVVEGASDQAIVLRFNDIEWLNYDAKRPYATKLVIRPEDLPDVRPTAATGNKRVKSFLITWLGMATGTRDEECPVMNAKPGENEIYRYRTPEQIAEIKAKGGPTRDIYGSYVELRGPLQLNVGMLPGIVPDPGLHMPQTDTAPGIDLDGYDGRGTPPKGIRAHKSFVSPDGRSGVDNQALAIMGCVPGARGKQGYRNQTSNARRADGNITAILEISDIDNDIDDKNVNISIIHSKDKPFRDNEGKSFVPNYTFRPSDDPNFALYNIRVRGRMVNGVITSERMPLFEGHLGQESTFELREAVFRFDPLPDGSLKGVVAGYMDIDTLQRSFPAGYAEGLFNYQSPAMYYAIRQMAEKKFDATSDEYDGISVVYEIDTVPAFLATPPGVAKGGGRRSGKGR